MCRNPDYKFKRRIRFSKKDETLYMDVMLHLPDMVPLTHEERCRVVIAKLEREISEILTKYSFKDFDQARFETDLHAWFATNRSPNSKP